MPVSRPVAEARSLLAANDVVAPPVDVVGLASALGLKLVRQPFDGNLSGMLERRDGGAIVGVNSLHAEVRQRFTIAHEIGHYVLHRGNRFIDEIWVDYRDERASAGTYRQEVEANGFAAELLMPEDFVTRTFERLLDDGIEHPDADRTAVLADEFRVSRDAMSHRLANLAINLQI